MRSGLSGSAAWAALAACLFLFSLGASAVPAVDAHALDAETGATGSGKESGKPGLGEHRDFLIKNPVGVMATVDRGRPRTRVFMLLWVEGNRAYFSTGDSKAVARQIKSSPQASFCTRNQENSMSVSVNGKVTFTDDLELKKRAMAEYPSLKAIYKSPGNPDFSIFHLEAEEVVVFNM